MGEFTFTIVDVFAEPYAAAPQLTARVRVEESSGLPVHAIALRCQVRIEPQRRGYEDEDAAGMRAMFGERERWAQTLKPFMWMQCNTTVQGFTGLNEVDLPMPCTYDFDVAASRYLHTIGDGIIPLEFMFSGTIFRRGEEGFAVEQVPWDCDARYQMPVKVWRDMMQMYFPNSGWLRLDIDVLDQLTDFRERHGLTTWEETFTHLLESREKANNA